jgi:hypothetical protein
MWTQLCGAYTIKGKSETPSEIDWVLVTDGVERKLACPRGETGVAVDVRARVYERRTGVLVGEKVFPSLDPPCVAGLGVVVPDRAAQWAWNVLRLQPKKKD